jgi:DNA-directed RNA polymerase specialized sigma24 family protein
MQQRDFKKLVKLNLTKLKQVLRRTGIPYDDCQDILATVLDRAYRSKAYSSVSPNKAYEYLASRIRYAVGEYRQAEHDKAKRECPIPDDLDAPLIRFVESHTVPISECPFCHRETLNTLGTCGACRTAIPSNAVLHRGTVAIETVSLMLEQDLLQHTDVALAIDTLNPMEQKVVKACIMGNESLESFGQIEAMNRKTLWRTWVKARNKLRAKLADYA